MSLRKLDVSDIIRDHLHTFVNVESGRASVADWFFFLIVPVLVAGRLVWCSIGLSVAAVNIAITALAILAGLLFNLLLLTHGLVARQMDDPAGQEARALLRETYVNISFAILIALAAIILLVIRSFIGGRVLTKIVDFVSYAVLSNFVLTLFMILKRIHVTLRGEFI